MSIQNSFGNSKFFSDDEMRCPCCGIVKMDDRFMSMLDNFRATWGRPLFVTSGFRCKIHNKKVGGKPDSKHLSGEAADIGVGPSERYEFMKLAMRLGFGGLGVAKTFVHLDSRQGVQSIWTY